MTILNDSFFEDLGSTNGTLVNGQPVKKHFLQNNDVVEIGKYKLKYVNEAPATMSQAEFEKTMVLRAPRGGIQGGDEGTDRFAENRSGRREDERHRRQCPDCAVSAGRGQVGASTGSAASSARSVAGHLPWRLRTPPRQCQGDKGPSRFSPDPMPARNCRCSSP